MPDEFRQRLNLLRPAEVFSLEGTDLVRRAAGGERRWPLAELRRARLARHPLGPQMARQVLQLGFGGRDRVQLVSHSIVGIGRFQDDTAAFRAFALELLRRAPQSQLARAGSASVNSLWLVIAGMGLGALVMVASAAAAGALALGLDLGARMIFLLLLAACVLPWLERDGADRDLTPEALLSA